MWNFELVKETNVIRQYYISRISICKVTLYINCSCMYIQLCAIQVKLNLRCSKTREIGCVGGLVALRMGLNEHQQLQRTSTSQCCCFTLLFWPSLMYFSFYRWKVAPSSANISSSGQILQACLSQVFLIHMDSSEKQESCFANDQDFNALF